MNISEDLIEKAYKKLKSSVYYDKTQLILRNRIVELELEYPGKALDKYFKESIYAALLNDTKFNKLQNDICKKISVISLPKKLDDINSDIIINSVSNKISIKELQHYIDMPVEGHILGVLWIMLIGYKIDEGIYEHSYGNRIRKNLINELSDNPTYSPYLFEPYFEQYESWRDKAMSEAQKHMNLKQDVAIVTMDFKRYYYSLDINNEVMKTIIKDVLLDDEEIIDCCKRLNNFVETVIGTYSDKFEDVFEHRKILPIGFLPSNIIGNWCLKHFDEAIVDGWNPVYYGRYVDDILIVDKVERNGKIYAKVKNCELSKKDIIEYFLTSCTKWHGGNPESCNYNNNYAVIQKNEDLTKREIEQAKTENRDASEDKNAVYEVNNKYNPVPGEKNTRIIVQNEKVKIFYFKHDESDALITCFKSNIAKNKSEFRHLPEDEAVFQQDDYSDIYSLSNNDTVNKFRGIESISLDKYKLSKFLGKYLRVGGMIQDKSESRFEKDILKIFTPRAIIENYSMWEKIIEILTINEQYKALERFCKKVIEAIDTIEIKMHLPSSITDNVTKALYNQLHAGLCRSLALVWKAERKEIQESIYKSWGNRIETDPDKMIKGYYKSRMIDKSVMPIISDMIDDKAITSNSGVNLTHFGEAIYVTKSKWNNNDYKYYPYIINMYDFAIVSCIEQLNLKDNEIPFNKLKDVLEDEEERYINANYRLGKKDNTDKACGLVNITPLSNSYDKGAYIVSVGEEHKKALKVAIANVRINPSNFEKIVKDIPNRAYSRYKDLSRIVNMAIDEHADMLIMPEAYVPFEWLNVLARTCAKNNMAIVTGVEHIKLKKRNKGKEETNVYNYTATILPYIENTHRSAYIFFHLKKHYAPSEIEKIEGYRMKPICGSNYELYRWNDCYFPVYCCYELTSISDRSIFQAYADMIIAVEWNRDVKYYSNILESLSRDIHCYCIQVNSSEYGDSRIMKPSRSEEKDIIRTKGGINSSILVDNINISDLRDFQLKEYSLQQKDNRFKSTPPNFDKDIVIKKIKGEVLQ